MSGRPNFEAKWIPVSPVRVFKIDPEQNLICWQGVKRNVFFRFVFTKSHYFNLKCSYCLFPYLDEFLRLGQTFSTFSIYLSLCIWPSSSHTFCHFGFRQLSTGAFSNNVFACVDSQTSYFVDPSENVDIKQTRLHSTSEKTFFLLQNIW